MLTSRFEAMAPSSPAGLSSMATARNQTKPRARIGSQGNRTSCARGSRVVRIRALTEPVTIADPCRRRECAGSPPADEDGRGAGPGGLHDGYGRAAGILRLVGQV